MALEPLRVACTGMGWWSDVLADAMQRSKKLKIAACYTRSEDKRKAFAAKYACVAVPNYQVVLQDRTIEAIINTTPNSAHLETTMAAALAGKHIFLDKPIANTVSEGRVITEFCKKKEVILALGYQRRRESHFRWIRSQIDAGAFGKLVNAEANISRDRLGQIDLKSWRYTAAGMPGGVMLQIGIHYADVLEYLLGPVKAVSGRFAQLVLPGDNPAVASLVPCAKNDTFVEELEEFADAVRGGGKPEMGGEGATASLAVIRAGIVSAREGRRVEVAEMLSKD